MRMLKLAAALCLAVAMTMPLSGCIPFVAGMIAYDLIANPGKPKTSTTCVTPPGETKPQCTTATTS